MEFCNIVRDTAGTASRPRLTCTIHSKTLMCQPYMDWDAKKLEFLTEHPEPCPEGLEHWTADECAEALPGMTEGGLYNRLWEISGEAEDPTPLGGDGSNGTVEEPSGRLDERNDDKAKNFWEKLTVVYRSRLVEAFAKYEAQFTSGL